MTRSADLPARAAALLEAHVAFELQQWRGDNTTATLRAEADAIWAWAGQTPLSAAVSVDTVREAAVRLALDVQLPDALADVIAAIADQLVRLDINEKTQVQDVVDQNLFDEGVSLFVELEQLRARLLARVLESPVYAALASDVLYQGIKDYIFSDSGAINAIPGVSSLFKGSTTAFGKRLPGLEAQVEKRVRTYIANNMAKTLARSEQMMLDSLDEARIRAIAADIWASIHDKPLSIADVIDADELRQLIGYALRAVKELRNTEYAGELVEQAVKTYFERYGDRPITELMAHIGVDSDVLRQEAETLAPPIIDGMDRSGLLEDLIRRRLTPFYWSEAFIQALGGDS